MKMWSWKHPGTDASSKQIENSLKQGDNKNIMVVDVIAKVGTGT